MNNYRTFLFSVLLLWTCVQGQQKSIVVASADVERAAVQLIGDSTAWPILVSIADRETATNSFVLSSAAQKQIKDFAVHHRQVRQAQQKLIVEIKNGAKVFAAQALDSVVQTLKLYAAAVNNGRLEESSGYFLRIVSETALIERLIEENRNETIDAKLAQKTGIVDKRKGYLGLWENAAVGDLFIADDGVKTGEKSLAQLFFTDGVDVTVDPSTTIVIRASQLDKLNQTVKRDLALVNGSLLAKLSAKAKETNDFSFQAGSSESQIKSGKFWASTIPNKSARVSNYDGMIALSASNVRVTLQSNQGTVVEKGKPPLPPVDLLLSPELTWPRVDTVIYADQLKLEWKKIPGAVHYQIEASPSKDFDREIKRFSVSSSSFELTGIPLAVTYVRLQSIDRYSLRGTDSPVYKIIRTKNTQPPPIQIDGWDMDRLYTVLESVTIHGKTAADVKLTINNIIVKLDRMGIFTYTAPVNKTETQLNIAAVDQSGNISKRLLSIVPMDTAQVYRIDWNCAAAGDIVHPTGETVEARGTAYPHVRVTAELGTQKKVVMTSPQGMWAVSLKPVQGEVLRLTFESPNDNRSIGTKTWKVE